MLAISASRGTPVQQVRTQDREEGNSPGLGDIPKMGDLPLSSVGDFGSRNLLQIVTVRIQSSTVLEFPLSGRLRELLMVHKCA